MAVEKTEAEKIAVCRAFLEKRGFFVGERFMGAPEVAELLGVSTTHLVKLDIPCVNVGCFGKNRQARRYQPSDVNAWIEKHKGAA